MNNIQTPASHLNDPDSSHIAEESITKSGRRQNQIDQVVEYVRLHPGSTSGEIAVGLGGEWNNVSVSRRLSDAKGIHLKQGDSRKCGVKGSTMVSWHPMAGFKCLGQHQAYCVAGKTVEKQRERLAQVPDEYQEQVRRHLRTVWQLKRKAELAARRG